jgi:hypothetical protein
MGQPKMKTKSTGYLVLLTDGYYRGFWVGNTVTVPFALEDISFDVVEVIVGKAEVEVSVRDGIAYIETI